MKIPEIDEPKIKALNFKCSEKEHKIIMNYCEKKNYRFSAFCRVAVLKHIKDDKKKKGKK